MSDHVIHLICVGLQGGECVRLVGCAYHQLQGETRWVVNAGKEKDVFINLDTTYFKIPALTVFFP